jgi:hypothetical protein
VGGGGGKRERKKGRVRKRKRERERDKEAEKLCDKGGTMKVSAGGDEGAFAALRVMTRGRE